MVNSTRVSMQIERLNRMFLTCLSLQVNWYLSSQSLNKRGVVKHTIVKMCNQRSHSRTGYLRIVFLIYCFILYRA